MRVQLSPTSRGQARQPKERLSVPEAPFGSLRGERLPGWSGGWIKNVRGPGAPTPILVNVY